MKRQRGVITWEMVIFVVAFGSATATTPEMVSQKFGPYPDATSCIAAMDQFNVVMAAPPRATETKVGRAVFEWKARCVQVGQ